MKNEFSIKKNPLTNIYKSIFSILDSKEKLESFYELLSFANKNYDGNLCDIYENLPSEVYFTLLELYIMEHKIANSYTPTNIVKCLLDNYKQNKIEHFLYNYNSIGYYTWKTKLFNEFSLFSSSEWNMSNVKNKINKKQSFFRKLFNLFSPSTDLIKSISYMTIICEGMYYTLMSYPKAPFFSIYENLESNSFIFEFGVENDIKIQDTNGIFTVSIQDTEFLIEQELFQYKEVKDLFNFISKKILLTKCLTLLEPDEPISKEKPYHIDKIESTLKELLKEEQL